MFFFNEMANQQDLNWKGVFPAALTRTKNREKFFRKCIC